MEPPSGLQELGEVTTSPGFFFARSVVEGLCTLDTVDQLLAIIGPPSEIDPAWATPKKRDPKEQIYFYKFWLPWVTDESPENSINGHQFVIVVVLEGRVVRVQGVNR